ncbi:alpha-ketoglutarate-dependent dioxygenase AlkB [Sphingomonas sp. GCM10030256]|uniref:alpha-ketoglutarate-dependent dioxygenase AlkB n=1 Tax=Sphingomonas sp. GCM10030256 TaxID=3273427 RepID=UPI003610F17D
MDLFDAPLIPGLRVRQEFVTAQEEQELIARIGEIQLAPFKFQGFEGKRLTRTFGWRYDFQDGSFCQAEPLPDWLLPLRDRAAAFAGLPPDDFGHALLIRYDPGAGIGWHKDRPVFEDVVGISLGAAVQLAFRQRLEKGFRRVKLPLETRSAYLLRGEVRQTWEHGIAAHPERRWSITFRSLSEKGRKILQTRSS